LILKGRTYLVIAPRYENGIPIKRVKAPAIKQAYRAVFGDLAAIHRDWKSRAAKFPNPKIKIVAQFLVIQI
jgi:hypothetical protein